MGAVDSMKISLIENFHLFDLIELETNGTQSGMTLRAHSHTQAHARSPIRNQLMKFSGNTKLNLI